MFETVVLTLVLLKEPMKLRRVEEGEYVVCFDSNPIVDVTIPNPASEVQYATVTSTSEQNTVFVSNFSRKEDFASLTVEERFRRLSEQWSQDIRLTSSTTRAIANPKYQAIIKLGWTVVPLMLRDLQNGSGYWYPALNAITGIRPFDRRAAGNTNKMTKAWLDWGRKKNLV
jgi:hypothetical protein